MNLSKLALVSLTLIGSVLFSGSAFASSYEMRGTQTDIWDHDVDYFSSLPIQLVRTKGTWRIHEINFNVLRYESYCAAWQSVCVAHNSQGQCTAWEQRCVQIGYRTYQVPKQVQLDFGGLPLLADGEQETYEIQIQRMQPNGDGTDWVSTWFRGVKTKAPVKVLRFGDYSYRIDPK